MEIKFVGQDDPDLIQMSKELDGFYFSRFGKLYLAYRARNVLDGMAGAAVAYEDSKPCGCCCWKPFDAVTAEIKRVYVSPECRRKGVAKKLMETVELHAARNGCHRAVLETAKATEESVAFYRAVGYYILETDYGQYAGDAECVCLEKEISDGTMR